MEHIRISGSSTKRDWPSHDDSERLATSYLPRKEVIHPHLPVRIPCYDFTPIANHTLGTSLLTVRPATSGATNSRGVTGGVYKTRERIQRGMLTHVY